MHDDRKQDKTGPLSLDQAKARALGTGIGQSKDAAMMTGKARAMRVADCIPASQKKAVAGCDTGYPQSMDYMNATIGAAVQGPLAIRGRRR